MFPPFLSREKAANPNQNGDFRGFHPAGTEFAVVIHIEKKAAQRPEGATECWK
jgi:hypothetical protein